MRITGHLHGMNCAGHKAPAGRFAIIEKTKTMRHFTICLLVLICLGTLAVRSQELVVPKGYTLEEDQDYAKFNSKIVEIADWLESTPLDRHERKRTEAQAFLFEWISGSPDVTITLRMHYLNLSKKNPQLLFVFMGGWTRYAIEHPEDSNEVAAAVAGIECVIRCYQLEGSKKDGKVNKVVKMKEEGSLHDWVERHLDK